MHRGGGNSLKLSHNQDFSLIEAFNNLALWGEKKFVSELKRTYKFQRGVYCHTEDNSPKYRMVGKILSILRSFAVQTRIFAKECNIMAGGYVRSTAQDDENLNRLRNKCAMTSVGDMKENNFSDKVHSLFTTHNSLIHNDTIFSRFTSHFSLKRTGATHVALCDSVGSYFRHWCGAFTLAEVLITLGIIGVVAAMTMPALIANTKKSEISAKLKKFNTTMAQCVLLSEQDNGPAEEWSNPGEYDTFDLDKFFKTYLAPYIKYSSAGFKTEYGSKRYYVYLLDGGYFYFFKGNCVDIVYDVNGSKKPNAHGRDIFRFLLCGSKSPEWCDGRHFCPMYSTSAHTREEKIQDCIKGDRGSGCTGLLEYDGWEFKKDYPIRL